MSAQHTPGPLRAFTLRDHDGPPACDDVQVQGLVLGSWERIAELDWDESGHLSPTREQAEAYARLFAVAPELLAAAIEARRALSDPLASRDPVVYETALRALDTAIDKATGDAE